MEVELTDKEFIRLTRMLLIQHSLPEARRGHVVYNLLPIDQKLVDRLLLKIKSKQIDEDRTVDYMTLTQWGYHVLTQERLRLVLCLHTLNASSQTVWSHMKDIPKEELSILLVHDNTLIRETAIDVMRFYEKSEEELWEEFLAKR